MSVEAIRQVFEEELGPDLRAIRSILVNMSKVQKLKEEIERISLDMAIRRLEFARWSRRLEARISALEADKRISASV